MSTPNDQNRDRNRDYSLGSKPTTTTNTTSTTNSTTTTAQPAPKSNPTSLLAATAHRRQQQQQQRHNQNQSQQQLPLQPPLSAPQPPQLPQPQQSIQTQPKPIQQQATPIKSINQQQPIVPKSIPTISTPLQQQPTQSIPIIKPNTDNILNDVSNDTQTSQSGFNFSLLQYDVADDEQFFTTQLKHALQASLLGSDASLQHAVQQSNNQQLQQQQKSDTLSIIRQAPLIANNGKIQGNMNKSSNNNQNNNFATKLTYNNVNKIGSNIHTLGSSSTTTQQPSIFAPKQQQQPQQPQQSQYKETISTNHNPNGQQNTVKISPMGGWVFYIGTNVQILHDGQEQCGKWMYFWNNRERVTKLCYDAVALGAVVESKHSDGNDGVACFYLNGNDLSNHRKIIQFFIENNMFRRKKNGDYIDSSFKFDTQTLSGQYGSDFESKLKLSQFINMTTGEWKLGDAKTLPK